MAELIVGRLDFNDLRVVALFENVVQAALDRPASYIPLRFKPGFYFSAPSGTVFPSEGGWYIILAGQTPIYVGQADDLNSRLNSNQGSLDNFAKKDRTSDAERNFVKRFAEIGRVPDLRVCLITRAALASGLAMSGSPFAKVDVDNIEKVLNILVEHFDTDEYAAQPFVAADGPEARRRRNHHAGPPQNNTLKL